MNNSRLVKCGDCGWVHFSVSADYIRQWEAGWVKYWQTLDDEGKEAFGVQKGPPGPEQYFECFRCGEPYTNCVDAKGGDCRAGSTIQPILDYKEIY